MDSIEAVQVMTHPTRFQLMQLLGRHPYCVKALAKKLGISESAVSQHMNVLKKYGIVSGVRMGYQVHYIIDEKAVNRIMEEFTKQLSQLTEQHGDASFACEFAGECNRRDGAGEKSCGK